MRLKCIILLVLLIGIFDLSIFQRIGPEYDEALYVNSAVGCHAQEIFITLVKQKFGTCFPVMVSVYLGALPSYFYRVYFFFSGHSIVSLREFSLLLYILWIFLVYILVSSWRGRKVAAWVSFFLLLDFPLFLDAMFKTIVVFPAILKTLAMLFFLLGWKHKKRYMFLFSGIFIGIAFWTKLDVFFFFAPLALPATVIFQRKIFLKRKQLIWLIIGTTIGVFPLLYFLIVFRSQVLLALGKMNPTLSQTLFPKLGVILFPLVANSLFAGMLNYQLPSWLLGLGLSLFGGFIFLCFYLLKRKYDDQRVLSIASLLFIASFVLFPLLEHSHHFLLIYPLPQILLALWVVNKNRTLKLSIVFIFLCLFIIQAITFNLITNNNCGWKSWSCGIIEIGRKLQRTSAEIVVTDWGMATQLLYYIPGQRIHEIAFHNLGTQKAEVQNYMNQCAIFLSHTDRYAHFISQVPTINAWLNSSPKYKMKVISPKEQGDQYLLYSCR